MTDDERIGALQQAVVEAVNESCLPLGVKALVLENLLLRVTAAIRAGGGTPASEPPAPGGESA